MHSGSFVRIERQDRREIIRWWPRHDGDHQFDHWGNDIVETGRYLPPSMVIAEIERITGESWEALMLEEML